MKFRIGKQVVVLAERLKKKDAPAKFCKSSTQKKSCFYQDEIFVITKKQKNDNQYFYWLTNTKTKKFIKNRFQRQKIYSLSGNFI